MQLVEFITTHWILCTLMLLASLLLLQQEWHHRSVGIAQITPEQAVQWINRQQAVVVDIRTEAVFAKGHIVGSINVENTVLASKIQYLEKYRERPLIIVCQAGHTALKAAQLFRREGFKAFVLGGGLQQWTLNGLPLVQ